MPETVIPPLVDAVARISWSQPDPAEIIFDDVYALMERKTFEALNDVRIYDGPAIPGKMWRYCYKGNEWWLWWFGLNNGGFVTVEQRRILLV